jgi:hypothetical protein
MAEFIAPVVEWLLGVLRDGTPALLAAAGLEPFAEFRKSWTWTAANWPPVAVMPRTTTFGREGTLRDQTHVLTVKFGVNGADPEQLTADVMTYMTAIDDAIAAAEATWPEAVKWVFIGQHDYGPLYEKDSGFTRFPEMHIEVEAKEL